MASRRKDQRGITLFGLMFWAIVVGFLALLTMRVLPTLNEYFTIATEIVHAHGGTIWAENRSEGGARVAFTLPLD
jgi:hypothetical protein